MIKEVISSITRQDFPHELMEVVFVDDGSEDKTLQIVSNCASEIGTKTKVIHQDWRGLGVARNTVVSNAEGSYIIWVDGDMLLVRDYVRKQVEFIERNYSMGIVSGKYGISDTKSLIADLELIGFVARDHRFGEKPAERLPGTGGSIFRVEAIKQAGGFDGNLKHAGEDTDIAYRIKEAGWLIYLGADAVFFEHCKASLKDIWRRYLLHGYCLHYVIHKDKGVEKLHEMIPPAAFLSGLLYSIIAYKLVRRKFVFLLPIFNFFKMTAWCLGLVKSHIKGYGHFQH